MLAVPSRAPSSGESLVGDSPSPSRSRSGDARSGRSSPATDRTTRSGGLDSDRDRREPPESLRRRSPASARRRLGTALGSSPPPFSASSRDRRAGTDRLGPARRLPRATDVVVVSGARRLRPRSRRRRLDLPELPGPVRVSRRSARARRRRSGRRYPSRTDRRPAAAARTVYDRLGVHSASIASRNPGKRRDTEREISPASGLHRDTQRNGEKPGLEIPLTGRLTVTTPARRAACVSDFRRIGAVLLTQTSSALAAGARLTISSELRKRSSDCSVTL